MAETEIGGPGCWYGFMPESVPTKWNRSSWTTELQHTCGETDGGEGLRKGVAQIWVREESEWDKPMDGGVFCLLPEEWVKDNVRERDNVWLDMSCDSEYRAV
jgi:hypothetical protein